MAAAQHPTPEVGDHPVVELRLDAALAATTAAFVEVGATPQEGHRIAHSLIDAELCEVPTHGLMRVPRYLREMREGVVAVGAAVVTECSAPAVARVDGHGALGYLPTWTAVGLAADRAAEAGVGVGVVRNIAEFGRAAYYAAALAEQGLVGLVCQNTLPMLAAPGAAVATHGNNPLAYTAPGADAPVFDAAFTARSGGELHRRALLGLPVPSEWGYHDRDGNPTTDPRAAFGAVQQAVAGAKGFGMAVLVDLLAGVLAGAGSGVEIPAHEPVVGAFVMALDPARFGVSADQMQRQFAASAEAVRSSGGRWPGDRARSAAGAAGSRGSVRLPRPIFDVVDEAMSGRLRPAAT